MATILEELTIAAPPERVWAALTRTDEIGRWWTNDLNATPEVVGSLAEFRFGEWGDTVIRVEVAELEPYSQIHWIHRFGPLPHWKGTTITWSFRPVSQGTQVLFAHDGFAQADERFAITSAWWEHFLVSLKAYLETGVGFPGSPRANGGVLRTLS